MTEVDFETQVRRIVRQELTAANCQNEALPAAGRSRDERAYAMLDERAGAQPTPEVTRIVEACQGLESLCKRLYVVSEELQAFNDSRLGEEADGKGSDERRQPSRGGQSGLLLDLIAHAHDRASWIEQQVARLQAL